MLKLVKNPHFATNNLPEMDEEIPFPSIKADLPLELLSKCPAYKETPLVTMPEMAKEIGIDKLVLKDETGRMGLGSFKALGAAYVIAYEAAQTGQSDLSKSLQGRTFVTASAGNHGLSVAAGAQVFGANSVIFLAETVPSTFADRLREKGAEVQIVGVDYEASMLAAQQFASERDLILLSDSSWKGYYHLPHRLMEGYLVSAHEIVDQMEEVPSHVFLQAGVGGLAGAMAAYFRHKWGAAPIITVVEPEYAPALQASILKGKSIHAEGPDSCMGRLDCKEPSLIALKGLARDANYFLTITEEAAQTAVGLLSKEGLGSTPSGVAGLAAAFDERVRNELGMGSDTRVLAIISEGRDA